MVLYTWYQETNKRKFPSSCYARFTQVGNNWCNKEVSKKNSTEVKSIPNIKWKIKESWDRRLEIMETNT